MYKIVFTAKSRKELKHFSKEEARKILAKINQLSHSFKPNLNIVKLAGSQHSYRLRTGKLRVILEVDHQENLIWITKVGYRRDIYRFS